jgi:hypothetical protein
MQVPPLAEYPREILRKLKGVYYTDRIEMSGEVIASKLYNQVRWRAKGTEYVLPFKFKLETRKTSLAGATGGALFYPESWEVRLQASPESYFRLNIKRKEIEARLLRREVT